MSWVKTLKKKNKGPLMLFPPCNMPFSWIFENTWWLQGFIKSKYSSCSLLLQLFPLAIICLLSSLQVFQHEYPEKDERKAETQILSSLPYSWHTFQDLQPDLDIFHCSAVQCSALTHSLSEYSSRNSPSAWEICTFLCCEQLHSMILEAFSKLYDSIIPYFTYPQT